jgi:hypothetical protein
VTWTRVLVGLRQIESLSSIRQELRADNGHCHKYDDGDQTE